MHYVGKYFKNFGAKIHIQSFRQDIQIMSYIFGVKIQIQVFGRIFKLCPIFLAQKFKNVAILFWILKLKSLEHSNKRWKIQWSNQIVS